MELQRSFWTYPPATASSHHHVDAHVIIMMPYPCCKASSHGALPMVPYPRPPHMMPYPSCKDYNHRSHIKETTAFHTQPCTCYLWPPVYLLLAATTYIHAHIHAHFVADSFSLFALARWRRCSRTSCSRASTASTHPALGGTTTPTAWWRITAW